MEDLGIRRDGRGVAQVVPNQSIQSSGEEREPLLKGHQASEAQGETANLDYVMTVAGAPDNIPFGTAVVHELMQGNNGGIMYGMRLNAVNLFPIALMSFIQSLAQLMRGKKIGDMAKKRLAILNITESVFLLLFGGALTGARAVGIASLYTASKSLVIASAALGYAISGIGIPLCIMRGIPAVINGIRTVEFLKELNQKAGTMKHSQECINALQFLMDQLMLTPNEYTKASQETLALLQERGGLLSIEDKIKEAITTPLSEEEEGKLTPEDKTFINQEIQRILRLWRDQQGAFRLIKNERLEENLETYVFSKLGKRILELREIKENSYRTKIGQNSLNKILEEIRKPVEERLVEKLKRKHVVHDSKKAAKEIVNLTKKEAVKQIVIRSLVILSCVLGIAAFTLGCIYTGGAPIIVMLVLFLITVLIDTGLGLYSLHTAANNLQTSNKKDKALILFFIFVTIASIVLGSILSGGVVAMGVVVGVGATVLGIQLYGLYHSHRASTKAKERALFPSERQNLPRQLQVARQEPKKKISKEGRRKRYAQHGQNYGRRKKDREFFLRERILRERMSEAF